MKKTHKKTIEQSKSWLIQAFFTELAAVPYENITVTQIAQQADLSRRTFYRHFTTKEALLQQYLKSLLNDYTQLLLTKKIIQHEDTLLLFFNFWQKYAPQLRLLQKRGLFGQLLLEVNQWYPKIYQKLQVPWHSARTAKTVQYASAFGAGGYFNILSLWVQEGCRETPLEMTSIVKNILQAFHSPSHKEAL